MSDENNDGIDDDEVNANAQAEAQDRLRNGVIQAYRDLLGREPENESVVDGWMRHPHGLPGIRGAIASSPEYSLPETVARRQRPSQAPTTPPSQRVPLAGGLEEDYTRQLAGGLQHRSGDLPAARVVDENKAAWEAELREAARVAGLPYDPGTLEGLIRQVTYARNAGTHSSHFLAQAKANYAERANNLTGGVVPGAASGAGPATTTPPLAPAAAARASGATQMQGGPQVYSVRPNVTPAPQVPLAAPVAPSPLVTPTAGTAGAVVAPFIGSAGQILAPPSAAPLPQNAWGRRDGVNRDYMDAVRAYPGGGSPFPWEASRGMFGGTRPRTAARWGDPSQAPENLRRDATVAETNATLAQDDFRRQYAEWERQYNTWRQPRYDPSAPVAREVVPVPVDPVTGRIV